MKVLAKVLSAAFLIVLPVIVSAVPLPSATEDIPETATEKSDEPLAQSSSRLSLPVAEKVNPAENYEFYDYGDDPVVLERLKRDMYDRDPWGRIQERRGPYYKKRYGRKNSRYSTRRYSRGRRREHHNYRGPDYGDDFEGSINKLTNAGYIDTSVFDRPVSPPKPNNNFVSARTSGIARTETSGSSI